MQTLILWASDDLPLATTFRDLLVRENPFLDSIAGGFMYNSPMPQLVKSNGSCEEFI